MYNVDRIQRIEAESGGKLCGYMVNKKKKIFVLLDKAY